MFFVVQNVAGATVDYFDADACGDALQCRVNVSPVGQRKLRGAEDAGAAGCSGNEVSLPEVQELFKNCGCAIAVAISEALEDEVRRDPAIEMVEGARPMAFDSEGDLQDLSRELAAAGVAPSQQDDAW